MPLDVIDGMRVNRGPDEPWRLLNQAGLLGVEVYRSAAEAPLQFGGVDDVDCGVIVIWTRTGAGSNLTNLVNGCILQHDEEEAEARCALGRP